MDQIFFLLSLSKFEGLLNDKVTVVVADKGEKARRLTYLSDEDRASRDIAVLKTLFYDAR